MEAAGSDETLPFLLTRAMGPREEDGTFWIYSEAIPNGSYPEASPMVTNSEASPNGKVVPNG